MSCISFESCEIFSVMFFARKYLFSLALLLFFHTRPQEEPTTWTGYFGKVLMASTTYLPAQVSEMFTQGRAFATVRLPFSGHKNICALAMCELLLLFFFFSPLFLRGNAVALDAQYNFALFLQNPEDSTSSGGSSRRIPLPVQSGPTGGGRMHTDEAAQVMHSLLL